MGSRLARFSDWPWRQVVTHLRRPVQCFAIITLWSMFIDLLMGRSLQEPEPCQLVASRPIDMNWHSNSTIPIPDRETF
ncbi:hypothetical protein F5146DRAFT_1040092, partial [Armillaria mellea]